MLSAHSGALGALACLTAALALVRSQNPPADLPVTRMSDAVPQAATQEKPQPAPSTPLQGLPVTKLDDRARSADLDAPQRLSIAFVEPADVRDVLLLLVRGTTLSIAVDPDVKGSFVGELKDVTLRRAIETVLTPNGLSYEMNGSVIHICTRRTETRFYDLNFLNLERTLQRPTKTDGEAVVATRVAAGDALSDAAAGVQTLLSDAGKVHVDRRAGLAQVTDYADRLDRVGTYIEALHIRGSRQVRLQARLLEVTLRGSGSIDWRAVRSKLGLPDRSLTAGAVVDAEALQAVLANQGEVEVVAAPELVALNNEPAVVHVGATEDTGLTLTVVPQISADGIVQLSLSPSWKTRTGGARTREGTLSTDRADTVVRVMDGSTVMVSGLLHPDDRTEPATGVAGVFGAEKHRRVRKELVVLLTPTVVNAAAGPVAAR